MVANTPISTPPERNSRKALSTRTFDSEKPSISTPSTTSNSSAMRPRCSSLSMVATASAPSTDPAPDEHSRIVKTPGPPWKTSFANTGRKTISGKQSMVIRNASAIRPTMPSRPRMKWMPCFTLVRMESPVGLGMKRVRTT